MRIFITGATGFLGAHTLNAVQDAGHDVAALIRPETDPWRIRARLDDITAVPGSLDDPSSFFRVFNNFKPDAVVNVAWGGVGNTVHDDPAQATNLPALEAFLQLAADTGVEHWIGLGSQAEYGPKDHPIGEDARPQPVTAYGRAKLAASALTEDFCARYGIRSAWLRLFSCYGPMDKESWLIPSLTIKLLNGEAPSLTEGRQRMDYLYATDAADAIRAVLECPAAAGIFNLGSGSAVPVRDIATRIRDLIAPKTALGFGEIPQRAGAQMLMQADISKLTSATGWKPKTSLNDGLAATVDWFRTNQTA